MKEFNRYIIDGYLSSIEQNFDRESYIQYAKDKKNRFRNIDFPDFEYPSWISNAIIEQRKVDLKSFKKIASYLVELLCKFIVIQITDKITLKDFANILEIIESHNIHKCLFVLNFTQEFYTDEFLKIILNSNRINGLVFFNSPFDKNLEDFIFYYQVIYTKKNEVSKGEFTSNRLLFSESKRFHTYFNRKLFIGSNGDIKNAPECRESFGNIHDISCKEELFTIVQSEGFRSLWYAHKDVCDVCKDCEFRHMCVDNRIPKKRENGSWYFELDCNYNPYIGKWKRESGYMTLLECGIISNKNEFFIDHSRITSLNSKS